MTMRRTASIYLVAGLCSSRQPELRKFEGPRANLLINQGVKGRTTRASRHSAMKLRKKGFELATTHLPALRRNHCTTGPELELEQAAASLSSVSAGRHMPGLGPGRHCTMKSNAGPRQGNSDSLGITRSPSS